jgi:hypothetical protein
MNAAFGLRFAVLRPPPLRAAVFFAAPLRAADFAAPPRALVREVFFAAVFSARAGRYVERVENQGTIGVVRSTEFSVPTIRSCA